jgi:rod shape-determining protein MreD
MDDRTPGIRPRPSLWRQLDQAARASFPAGSTVLLLLMTAAPFQLPDQGQLLPAVSLACVWFWSVFRPAAVPPPVVFLLGVFCDLLGYQPLGVSVLTLLVVHGIAVRWRQLLIRQGFVPVWLAFTVLAALAAVLGWALSSLLTFRLLPPVTALLQFVLTAALYPGLAVLLTLAHRGLAEAERG